MLKGAVIGFGRMGLTHFSILNNNPDVEFVGICDSSSFMLSNIERYIKVPTFKDPRKMMDSVELDFVIVATPTVFHADAVKYAIEKNIHVFVEKPFSLNPDEGRKVLDSLTGKDLIHQVGYVNRFNDVMLKVKELLDTKVLGDLLLFKMEMNGPTLLKDAKDSWRSKKKAGGGCLYDFASHSIDMVNYLVGVPDEIVGTVFQSIHSKSVEDAMSSTFCYDNGMRGNLLANWSDPAYRKPATRFEILGRKGKIVADLHAYKLFLREKSQNNGYTQGWNQCYVTDFVEPVRFYVRGFEFTRQLDYFIDCVKNKKENTVCSFKHGFETDQVIDRMIQDAGSRG